MRYSKNGKILGFKIGHKSFTKVTRKDKFCVDCNKKISHNLKAKKCNSCAKKGNKFGFQKGQKIRLGQRHSDESKEKIRSSKIGIKKTNRAKKNISLGMIKCYDIKGRKAYKRYIHLTATKEYKKWRSSVFERDNWTCRTCGMRGIYLEAHHIKSWAHFPEMRFSLENGLALCLDCHKLTDNYKNKKHV